MHRSINNFLVNQSDADWIDLAIMAEGLEPVTIKGDAEQHRTEWKTLIPASESYKLLLDFYEALKSKDPNPHVRAQLGTHIFKVPLARFMRAVKNPDDLNGPGFVRIKLSMDLVDTSIIYNKSYADEMAKIYVESAYNIADLLPKFVVRSACLTTAEQSAKAQLEMALKREMQRAYHQYPVMPDQYFL